MNSSTNCPHPTLYARDMFNQPQAWGECLLCERDMLRLKLNAEEAMRSGLIAQLNEAVSLLEQIRNGSEDEWPALNDFLDRTASS